MPMGRSTKSTGAINQKVGSILLAVPFCRYSKKNTEMKAIRVDVSAHLGPRSVTGSRARVRSGGYIQDQRGEDALCMGFDQKWA